MSTIYVSASAANGIPAGSDTTGDGSRERPWATIDKANAAAADGDTVLLNDGVYSPAKTLVISNAVTWLPVTDYGATILGVAGQSRVIGISEDNGGTVTFGKIIIDGGNANGVLITANDQPTAYTLHLDGTHLVNPVSYGIQGVSTGTHANFELEGVDFSGPVALSMINVQALVAGSVSITGGSVDLPGIARSGYGGIATINAAGSDVPVVISGVTANLNAAGAGGIYYGIRLTDVAHPLIERNDITQTGTATDQVGYTILVNVDPTNPFDSSDGVIRYNTLRNLIDGGASKIILVGADSDPGAIARNHVNNYQIYGNTGIGDTGAEAAKLHGILVGWQTGAEVYGNSMDYTDLAYVLKGMSGETLVFDNTDTHTYGKSLYQKGGTGVEFLYNTSYEESGYSPDIINIGDLSDSAYNASNATIIGNAAVFTGTPDSFVAVSKGSSTTSIAGNSYYSADGTSGSAWLYKGTSYGSIDAWKAAFESSAASGAGTTVGQGAILGAFSLSGQEMKLIGMVNGVLTYYITFATGTASEASFAVGNLGAAGAATISGAVDADLAGDGSASLSGTGLYDQFYGPLAGGDYLTFTVSYDGLSALGGEALHIYGNYTNTRPVDIIFGGALPVAPTAGNDAIAATDQNNTVYALAGNDTVDGGEGNDTIWGGVGDDRLTGGVGDDLIYGEAGTDTAVFSAVRADVTVTRGSGGAIIVSSAEGTDTFLDVELFSFAGLTFTAAELTASHLALSGPITLLEGDSGTTTFLYTVSRTGDITGTSSAAWAVTGSGTNAADAADFGGTLPQGTVSFAAGETSKTIAVGVAGDLLVEAAETFTLTLTSPSAGTLIGTAGATGTIANDDVLPAPSLSLSGAVTHTEGSSGTTAYVYTVSRTGDVSGTSSAQWSVAGSGTNPANAADFGGTLPSGTINFAAGETSTTITLGVTGDTAVELDETFTLTLASPSAGTDIATASSTGTIVNDDTALLDPNLALSGSLSLAEGNSGATDFTYTVTRTGDVSGTSSAQWSVAGSGINPANAADFGGTLPSGTIAFAAGETSGTITVTVMGDLAVEGDETFTLSLSSPSAGTTIGAATATGTVQNDDAAPVSTVPTAGDDNLVGTGAADRIDGLAGNDSIDGGAGNDSLLGGAGNDTLIGGTGDDILTGGTGDDTYYADSISDSIIEKAGEGTDLVYFSGTGKFTLKSNVENLVLTGAADSSATGNTSDNQITGNAGSNYLTGADGNDILLGLGGNDTLEGGAGRDVLTGGEGADKFLFRTESEVGGGTTGLAADLITDWTAGDNIDLSKIDAIAATSTNDKFTFIGTTAFTAAGQLRVVQDTTAGETHVEGNTGGDLAADFSLVLTGLYTLVATDIVL